jgi:glyoxylase-like metal-dependent hydrolase (beta-lactamase superfamily II)
MISKQTFMKEDEPMVQEIAAGLYRIPIPLPGSLLGSVNAYVVKGRERHLIIDTGVNHDLCMQAMNDGLRSIDVDPAKTDFFVTHAHPDHFDLIPRFVREGSVIYLDELESDMLQSVKTGAMFADFRHFARLTGFPPGRDLESLLPPELTQLLNVKEDWPFRFVKNADQITCGDYRFRCITTPGHTRGHTCLYEPASRLFFAGDHLLGDITPGIQARVERDNPLRDYLKSLEEIFPLDVRLVLPGHGEPFSGFRQRIDELKEHHRARAAEIMAELENGSKGVFEVASGISWSVVNANSWESVPDLQKLLATGETFAHLQYLEGKGTLCREVAEGQIMFSLVQA